MIRYSSKVVNRELDVEEGIRYLLSNIDRNIADKGYSKRKNGWVHECIPNVQELETELVSLTNNLSATHGDILRALISVYARQTDQVGKRYWLEKTPGNEMILPFLIRFFPNLRAIYIVRDPRDVYLSWVRRVRRSRKPSQVEHLVIRWGMSVWAWQQFTGTGLAGLTIRYEDLVRYPKETLSLVCRFLEVEYEPILEKPTKNGSLWVGNSMHGDKFNRISTKPIGRWQKNLAKSDLEYIETYLGKAMVALGYPLLCQHHSFTNAFRLLIKHKKRKQVLGMLIRLYWPLELPDRLLGNITYVQ